MKYIVHFFEPIRFFSILIIISSLFLSGCEADRPIKIGFIGSLTGRMADIGISARNAVQVAVEQCNAQGGIHGRPIELIVRDDQYKNETAVQAVKELLETEVTAIVGPVVSNMAVAVVPYLNEARLVAVGSTVTTSALSGLDDYFFRVCPTAREVGRYSGEYQIRSSGMHRIAVAHEISNRAFSDGWLASKRPSSLEGARILPPLNMPAEMDLPLLILPRDFWWTIPTVS